MRHRNGFFSILCAAILGLASVLLVGALVGSVLKPRSVVIEAPSRVLDAVERIDL